MSGARPWLRSESMRALRSGRERDHPALPGRELLVGVEPEHRRVPAAADRRAVGMDRAERLARVLDDRQAHRLERGQVGRVAEDVDRQDRGRAVGDRRARPPPGRGSASPGRCRRRPAWRPRRRGVRARDERERRRDDLVAVATPTARSARCRPAVPDETALACGTPRRAANAASNSGTRGPSDRLPGAQDLEDRLLLRLAEHAAARAGPRPLGAHARVAPRGAARPGCIRPRASRRAPPRRRR